MDLAKSLEGLGNRILGTILDLESSEYTMYVSSFHIRLKLVQHFLLGHLMYA